SGPGTAAATTAPASSASSAAYSVSASASPPNPPANSTVTITGQLTNEEGGGVEGATMHAVWRYKATTATCDGGPTDASGGATGARDMGGGTGGYAVNVDVDLPIDGQTFTAHTSFTPG